VSAPRLTIERFRPAVIGENGQGGDVERIRLARAAAIEAIGAEAPTHRLKAPLYRDVDLESLPAVSWLLDRHLPQGGLAVLYGPPSSGKSFVALAWSMAIASGLPWLGFPTLFGPVVHVVAEGGRGFTARVKAYRDAHELAEPTAACFRLVGLNCMDAAEVGDFIADIAYATAGDPSLVVIDTLARSMPGGDENSARDVGLVIVAADRIREATGATVLLVHHTGKQGEAERGSSALRGAADSMFSLKSEDEILTLECTKQKDAVEIEPLRLRLVPVSGSCVVEPCDRTPEPKMNPTAWKMLRDLSELLDGGSGVAGWARVSGVAERSAYRTAKVLRSVGYVTQENKRYVLTPAGSMALQGSAT